MTNVHIDNIETRRVSTVLGCKTIRWVLEIFAMAGSFRRTFSDGLCRHRPGSDFAADAVTNASDLVIRLRVGLAVYTKT